VLPLHDANPTQRFPLVVLLLIAANVFVFAFVQPKGGPEEVNFIYERAAIPCELRQGEPLTLAEIRTGRCGIDEGFAGTTPVFPDKNVWLAVLVSMFLHGSWAHLLGNMWFLWLFGNNVEDYATKAGFLLVYLVTGGFAAAAHVLADPSSVTPVVGASGAIAGIMGMYLVLWPHARIMTLTFFFVITVIPVPAAVVLGFWFVLQFFTDPGSSVAWIAHVGGFVAGVGIGLLARPLKAPSEPAY
jgi:membrane associated rhomboid family serine protease